MDRKTWLRRAAATAVLPFAALTLTGCNGTSGPEEGTDVEDIVQEEAAGANAYDSAYNEGFRGQMDTLTGETVTVSATVNEMVSPKSFTIAGTDDTSVDPLLIVTDEDLAEISPGVIVKVTGVVREAFNLPTVEEKMDLEVEDGAMENWDGEPYLQGTGIEILQGEE